MNINLRLINRSSETNNAKVVIFQKNVATDFEEIAVAWKVVENLGRDGCHSFVYPIRFQVATQDSWGNTIPCSPKDATDGQAFEMIRDGSGDVLRLATTPAENPNEVEVRNNLDKGSIAAQIYRDGRLAASKTQVPPGQKAVFEFRPVLFVGVVAEVEEGKVMNSAIMSQFNTELSLYGITSADIVMTGGGPGPDATSFNFQLANVNLA